jgi:biopolymer transport protein ExbD
MAGGGSEGELNLIPYMDIMVNLLVYVVVLVPMVTLGAAPVSTSGYGPDGAKRPPALGVVIGTDGFAIQRDEETVATIARDGGDYPVAALATELRTLRDAGGVDETLTLGADPRVPYVTLVKTLEAVRTDARGDLFPKVALAVVRRGS